MSEPINASEDFVGRYFEYVYEDGLTEVEQVLREGASNTRARQWERSLSAQFLSLPTAMQEVVLKVVDLAMEIGCFHALAAVDGSLGLYDGDIDLTLMLGEHENLTAEPLSPTFRALTDERRPGRSALGPPAEG